MKTLLLVLFVVFGVRSAQAHALLPEGRGFDRQGLARFEARAFDDRYRIGDEWGKAPVTDKQLSEETAVFRRAAMATARAGGGTSFYLGKFAGFHVMATNHHVFPAAWNCLGNNI